MSAPARKRGHLVPLNDTWIELDYTRVSSDEQALKGLSLPTQTSDIQRYGDSHPTWMRGGAYQDVLSGKRDDRPGYQRLLEDARAHALAGRRVVVAVAALDRLGRKVSERVRAYEELKGLGAEIHSVRDGGYVSEVMYNLLAALAQEEVRVLGLRVSNVLTALVANGWHPAGKPAWGYRWRDATADERREHAPKSVLELHPVEAPYVRELWERVADGASLRSAAKWAAALPPVARGERNLNFTTVWQVCRTPVYIGRFGGHGSVRSYDDDVLSRQIGRWEPLIDEDLWTRAYRQLRLSARMPKQASGDYLLTGTLWCACGERMSGHSSAAKRTRGGETRIYEQRDYTCGARSRGAWTPERTCWYRAPARALDDAVLEALIEILDVVDRPLPRQDAQAALDAAEQKRQTGSSAEQLAAIKAALTRDEASLATLAVKLGDGSLDALGYELGSRHLKGAIEAGRAEVERLAADAPVPVPTWAAIISTVSGWAEILRSEDVSTVRKRLIVGALLTHVEPERVGHGQYVLKGLEWTELGQGVFDVALFLKRSGNLDSIDRFGRTMRSTPPNTERLICNRPGMLSNVR